MFSVFESSGFFKGKNLEKIPTAQSKRLFEAAGSALFSREWSLKETIWSMNNKGPAVENLCSRLDLNCLSNAYIVVMIYCLLVAGFLGGL